MGKLKGLHDLVIDGPRTPPPELERSGTLRFAVGTREGPRSSVWRVWANQATRDVYVSQRRSADHFKLPLHASGKWRVALTEKGALAMNWDKDRKITAVDPPEPMAGGWMRALSIVTAHTSLMPEPIERLPRDRDMSWWPPTNPEGQLWFELMLSGPDGTFDHATSFDSVGKVGEIALPGGGGVMLLANEVNNARAETDLRDLRARWRADHPEHATLPDLQALRWGTSNDDGHLLLWDLGHPWRGPDVVAV